MKTLLLFTLLFLTGNVISAQCSFDSTITSIPDLSGGNQVQCSDQVIVFTAPAGYDSYQWKYTFSSGGSPTNFPGETSNTLSIVAGDLGFAYVFVTITDNGCTEDSNEIMFDTWIFLSPAISHSSDTDLCFGETSIISNAFGGPQNFRWYKDGVIVQEGTQDFYVVSEAGSYILEVSYPQCPNQWLSSGVPVPFTVTGEAVTITETDGTLFTTENGTNYQWFLEGVEIAGENTFFYTPITTGNYTVEVTFQGVETCILISDIYFFDILSLEDDIFNSVVYFENTVAKKAQFLLHNKTNLAIKYSVFDLSGKKVISASSNASAIIIAADSWKNGLYICNITSALGNMHIKLVK
ncbi:MAG: hypothetical protein AUK33_11750 [Flavobacteriaceae bacterium CG2_30_34_30]|nr:T9SS type A sorting domain-containing protein [Flavobacteriia bacterium]OIP48973.1 MAG: hypothetical protein AUK33_11750 [Flavobacteriaceae bacterium CG2_30_34_30]PIQ18477.1 MAG: hypothetical protein COW66_06325 [Flavobacteriaceae bacterium CG18_big_fil_WC_8_21_14_2_50_34_36]PIV49933.1 MAG: hypothetical protein COS19_06025 [Flavobacteriaceae bacterium CG02_land_8_20_14_3_00_34_13]PJC08108.1 MAG: hypothetical protein CO068_02820 [Flavobacteriaceae bacterium CG_4_9_14_0_8_um_filter_34_30]